MLSAFISVIRLVWPFMRELLFKNKGVKHSIEKNRELNILFGLYVGMFALTLYMVDHALNNYHYYTEKLNSATIALDRFAFTQQLLNESREELKTVRNSNDAMQSDLRAANELIRNLTLQLPPGKAEAILNKQLQNVDTPGQRRDLRERLKQINQKYEPRKPP